MGRVWELATAKPVDGFYLLAAYCWAGSQRGFSAGVPRLRRLGS